MSDGKLITIARTDAMSTFDYADAKQAAREYQKLVDHWNNCHRTGDLFHFTVNNGSHYAVPTYSVRRITLE